MYENALLSSMDGDAEELMARLGLESLSTTSGIDSGGFRDDHAYLQERYVMAVGTDCCYDRLANDFVKCSNLRLAAPNAFPVWQKSPGRVSVEADKIVFDPTSTVGLNHINMFSGFDVQRKPGDVEPILGHLFSLCHEDLPVYDWVIKWIAYPLQHPGAKMKTALIFHGREGTGKNLFWDAIVAIYGRYGVTIGQSQIESEFNAWMSCKLFILANEVLSRRERRHIKGRLKALVTDPTALINQKNMPVRSEANHANLVFLSNETDPVDTDRSDRRYMVVNCERVFDREYYRNLAESINVGALYDYFLSVDLRDFSPHTQPLLTNAKTELLRQNMRSEQAFIEDWLDGEILHYPKMSVPSLMLYWAYRCWCAEHGEKFPATETRFGRALTDAGIVKSRVNVIGGGGAKKVVMAWVGEPAGSVSLLNFDGFQRLIDDDRERLKL